MKEKFNKHIRKYILTNKKTLIDETKYMELSGKIDSLDNKLTDLTKEVNQNSEMIRRMKRKPKREKLKLEQETLREKVSNRIGRELLGEIVKSGCVHHAILFWDLQIMRLKIEAE